MDSIFLYDCDIHGLTKAKVVTILNDKANGTLTLSLSCSLCKKIEEDIKHLEENRQTKLPI